MMALREARPTTFYAPLAPEDATADELEVMRQAFAGLLWCKQYYHYDVRRWLDGDPGQPPPPTSAGTAATRPGSTCTRAT